MAVKRVSKWRPIFLVQIYRMVRLGLPEIDICRTLGVSRVSLFKWRRERPELEEAVQLARSEREEQKNFPIWIYNRLSKELRVLWDKIQDWHATPGGDNIVELTLQDHGLRVRQQLFLHALCVCGFNPSEAMSMVNVAKRELDRWLASDLEFAELVAEVQWHKGNFFEAALVSLVKEGNPAAVMFANKTYNRERGYGQRVEVEHRGTVLHGMVDLSEIMNDLSMETRTEIMAALRKRDDANKPKILEHKPSIQENVTKRIYEGETA